MPPSMGWRALRQEGKVGPRTRHGDSLKRLVLVVIVTHVFSFWVCKAPQVLTEHNAQTSLARSNSTR
eukprot:2370397-Amphidinium_carterae.2